MFKLLVIKEMPIKTTMRNHSKPTRIGKVIKIDNARQGYGATGLLVHCGLEC